MLRFCTRLTRHVLLFGLGLIAITITLVRIIIFCVELYKLELEQELTNLLAIPVKIGHLHAQMRGFNPEVILQDIYLKSNTIADADLQLREVRFGINFKKLLLNQHVLSSSWVKLIGVKLSLIRQEDGSFEILGLQSGSGQPLWLLEGASYQILDSEITWVDTKRHGKAVTFKQVNLSLKNSLITGVHQASLVAKLPNKYGDKIRVVVNFTGNVFAADNLIGKVFFAGKNIKFAQLITGDLPLGIALKQGAGDVEIWGDWQKNKFVALSGEVSLKNLSLKNSANKRLKFQQLKTKFNWNHSANSWVLALQDYAAKISGVNYSVAEFILGSSNIAAQHLSARFQKLELAQFNHWYNFFAPFIDKLPQALNHMNLQGNVTNGGFFVDLDQQKYAVQAGFKQLNIQGLAGYPSVKNLSGSLSGTHQQGKLWLTTNNARLLAPDFFKQQLKIKQLHGNIYWQQLNSHWQLFSHDLVLQTPDFNSRHKFTFRQAKNFTESAFMDLQTRFSAIQDVSKLKQYLPIKQLPFDVETWLTEAFVAGKIEQADLSFYGQLDQFPFSQHQGVMQLRFSLTDAELHYAPQWPNFKAVNADLMLENEHLSVLVKQANILQLTGKNFNLEIPNLSTSDYLLASGKVNATLNAGLDFLQQLPLDLPIAAVFEQLKFAGMTTVDLALKVPLSSSVTTKINGEAKLEQVKVEILAAEIAVDNLSGSLKFTEQSLSAKNLQAQALGEKIQIDVVADESKTFINVAGKVSAQTIFEYFELKPLTMVAGTMPYHLQLLLPSESGAVPKLSVQSDLLGLTLKLPDGWAKTATQAIPMKISLDLTAPEQDLLPISISYDRRFLAKLQLHKQRQQLEAANILVGAGKLKQLQLGKINLEVNLPQVSVLEWYALGQQLLTKDSEATDITAAKWINLSLRTPKLLWNAIDLGGFKLDMQGNSKKWYAQFNSSITTGHLEVPAMTVPAAKIKVNLQSLNLTKLLTLDAPVTSDVTQAVTQLPLLKIQAEKVWWRQVNLGRLLIDTSRITNGVQFEACNLIGDNQQLLLTGDWKYENNRHRTRLHGNLNTTSLGDLINKLDFSTQLIAAPANIDLDFDWQAAPYQFSLADLNGSLNMRLTAGRLLGIEPGVGRLLGVLAIEQWVKRLQFDFSDLYQEGLSFNSMLGHFRLQNGVLWSDNFVIDAIPAKVTLVGEIDLVQQNLTQEVSVIPKSSGAVPIAGTIVGSIMTAVAQTLTGEYEEGYYLRSKYKLAGAWDQLEITSLHEQDGLLNKTWRGLTDFSWLLKPQKQP